MNTYHLNMRVLCWILVCVFMPLRVWAADSMTGHSPLEEAPLATHASTGHEALDCHGPHKVVAQDEKLENSSHPDCQVCGLCHALAYTGTPAPHFSPSPASDKPPERVPQIQSICLTPDYRPPIA